MSTSSFRGRLPLSSWIKKPIERVQRKRGFAQSSLLTDWPAIVGAHLSRHTAPLKLSHPSAQHGATLTLLCHPSVALEIQFQEAVIIERIATHFGYRAVEHIRIQQGVLAEQASPAAQTVSQPPDLAARCSDDPALQHISDEALQQALARLQWRLNQQALAIPSDEDDIAMKKEKES